MVRMNLQIADVSGSLLGAVDITLPFAEADAPDDVTAALCDGETPLLAFETIEREKVRTAVNPQPDVA
jgi:hypothetical protein